MTHTRTQVYLALIAGALLFNQLAYLSLFAGGFAFVHKHHIFIVAAASSWAYMIFWLTSLAPLLLGVEIARRAFGVGVRTSRAAAVVLASLSLLFALFPLLSLAMIVLSSLGIGIRPR